MTWFFFFFFKQKTAYEMSISDWSSDVCSSDLGNGIFFTTSEANGGGGGSGIAFDRGTLTNALDARLLTYFDTNTFQQSFYDATPALRALTDRMISFVGGQFTADPDLDPPGPAKIDDSQSFFTLDDDVVDEDLITFDGGTLRLSGDRKSTRLNSSH